MTTSQRPIVLCVDDEVRSLETLERTLDEEFDVLTANSADLALELLESHDVQVILCDQRMPYVKPADQLAVPDFPVKGLPAGKVAGDSPAPHKLRHSSGCPVAQLGPLLIAGEPLEANRHFCNLNGVTSPNLGNRSHKVTLRLTGWK